jgi:hypothetical protein
VLESRNAQIEATIQQIQSNLNETQVGSFESMTNYINITASNQKSRCALHRLSTLVIS